MTRDKKIRELREKIAEYKRLRKLAEGGRRFEEADDYYWKIDRAEGQLEDLLDLNNQS